jgi:hypothetical protein
MMMYINILFILRLHVILFDSKVIESNDFKHCESILSKGTSLTLIS